MLAAIILAAAVAQTPTITCPKDTHDCHYGSGPGDVASTHGQLLWSTQPTENWAQALPTFTSNPPLPDDAFLDPARFCRALVYFDKIEHPLNQLPTDMKISGLTIMAENGSINCRYDGGFTLTRVHP